MLQLTIHFKGPWADQDFKRRGGEEEVVKRKTLYSGGEVEVGVRSSYDLHVGFEQ